MSLAAEFKKFILRGNVVDLAVGIIIGGAFGKIVSSLVSDVIMPPIGVILGGIDFKGLKIVIHDAVVDAAGKVTAPEVTINIGIFIQTVVDFLIIGGAVFALIHLLSRLQKAVVTQATEAIPAAPVEPSQTDKLLGEIRDLLKSQSPR
jgi:large conductance mechanosensitive channel